MLLLTMSQAYSLAQSMSDQDIAEFVITEHEKGTSQAQIVTKLMQRGVTIDQIRKVKEKYERQQKSQGLGVKDITTNGSKDRMRKNNGKQKDNQQSVSKYRIKDANITNKRTYDENDLEFMQMQRELNSFMPDSADIYDKMYLEEMMREQEGKRKVFGRDIFNNKDLTFEPNMNIATPQNYHLKPGDAVFIDIYGASQKTIESTVSPDGTVNIEDFGQ